MPAATKRAALDVVFAVAVLWASAAADSSGRGAADAALAAGSLAALEWRLEHVLEPHLAALPPAAGDLVQWARDLCHQRHQDRKDVAFSVRPQLFFFSQRQLAPWPPRWWRGRDGTMRRLLTLRWTGAAFATACTGVADCERRRSCGPWASSRGAGTLTPHTGRHKRLASFATATRVPAPPLFVWARPTACPSASWRARWRCGMQPLTRPCQPSTLRCSREAPAASLRLCRPT